MTFNGSGHAGAHMLTPLPIRRCQGGLLGVVERTNARGGVGEVALPSAWQNQGCLKMMQKHRGLGIWETVDFPDSCLFFWQIMHQFLPFWDVTEASGGRFDHGNGFSAPEYPPHGPHGASERHDSIEDRPPSPLPWHSLPNKARPSTTKRVPSRLISQLPC